MTESVLLIDDASELLSTMGSRLAADGMINLYRAVHTLNGTGATLGLHDLSAAVRELEALLGSLRDHATPPSPDEDRRMEELLCSLEASIRAQW
jgi:HPt (histidine-containing phosphotransfer) domain-containing protein